MPALASQSAVTRCALGVMTKIPRVGNVKTRLTPPLTSKESATLSNCFLRDTAEAISEISRRTAVSCIGIYTPSGEEAWYRGMLPGEFELVLQRGANLGDRLTNAAKDILEIGFASVCLVGSDSPTIPLCVYEQAVRCLEQAGDRIVLGPSDDGGYYLIGMKKSHDAIFQRIAWSTEHVLSQTLERAVEIGINVKILPRWYDVDDRVALKRLCRDLFESDSNAEEAYEAPHTRSWLEEFLQGQGRSRIWPKDEVRLPGTVPGSGYVFI